MSLINSRQNSDSMKYNLFFIYKNFFLQENTVHFFLYGPQSCLGNKQQVFFLKRAEGIFLSSVERMFRRKINLLKVLAV